MPRHYKYKRRGKSVVDATTRKRCLLIGQDIYLFVRKIFFSITIPSGPLPNGYIKQLVFNMSSFQIGESLTDYLTSIAFVRLLVVSHLILILMILSIQGNRIFNRLI